MELTPEVLKTFITEGIGLRFLVLCEGGTVGERSNCIGAITIDLTEAQTGVSAQDRHSRHVVPTRGEPPDALLR